MCVYAIAISLLHTYCENENHCSFTCLPQTNKVDVASYTLVLMKKLSLCGTQKKNVLEYFIIISAWFCGFCLIIFGVILVMAKIKTFFKARENMKFKEIKKNYVLKL